MVEFSTSGTWSGRNTVRLVNTQKSHFVRRQPNAAVLKAPSHNGHSDVDEFRQLGVLLVFLGD